jgi:hypothetical protein
MQIRQPGKELRIENDSHAGDGHRILPMRTSEVKLQAITEPSKNCRRRNTCAPHLSIHARKSPTDRRVREFDQPRIRLTQLQYEENRPGN